ncbi:pentapeptide repeat-containing protein [Leekyejoonella antrihumi]|uniref:Pentapeptide repeat-containing protein n=1 Tax=Leekyejoonella antrihumi TaxID=1660198 RepID=A0A563DZW6_9MICO|nr:pentapeptide repeat-containing protein [Leekyejoonella antrihumi]TWP35786.1 hypothetical protein FGL98_12280 [Leekyejoonella antrihumi]
MPFSSPGLDARVSEWPRLERVWLLCGLAVTGVALGLATVGGAWIGISDLLTARGAFSYRAHTAPLDLVKINLPIAVGMGGLVAAALAYHHWRAIETSRFTAQSAAATAQLEGTPAAVRIAGVQAMATLADQTNNDFKRQQCIDALCAYLREPYRPAHADQLAAGAASSAERSPAANERSDPEQLQERDVRLAIISVIRGHLLRHAAVSWAGYDFDFTGAVFDGGSFRAAEFGGGMVSFRGATFTGGLVSFRQARFTGGQVYFNNATFADGPVSFDQAKLAGARVFFDHARFVDASASFRRSRFTGGQVSFDQATFAGGRVSFQQAQFGGALVSFDQATFAGGQVSFHHAQVTDGLVSFDQATFAGGQVSFDQASLSDGLLSFRNAGFTGSRVSFGRANLIGGTISFHGIRLAADGIISFNQARLTGTRIAFHGATLALGSTIRFYGTDLTDGRITLKHTIFTGGTVDLRFPHTWVRPPQLPQPAPRGLLLPVASVGNLDIPLRSDPSPDQSRMADPSTLNRL